VTPLLYALLACADPIDGAAADARAYAEALRSGACASIHDDDLRDDCLVATVERTGEDHCDDVRGERARGECWFRLAEHRRDASLCAKAAPYVDDCAMHVLSDGFATWLTKGARPGEIEDEAARRIAEAGLSPDDPRPWSAVYRTVLSRIRPFDRGACAAVRDPVRREACERTGVAHYKDLLNHARDAGLYPCDGGPLPPLLQHTPDPELDALRASRTDLCPSTTGSGRDATQTVAPTRAPLGEGP
jgi:hypothetical protein